MSDIWYGDHRGIKILARKEDFWDGTFMELVIWQVPTDTDHPHGLKYRLHFGTLSGECIVRYDNRRGKGDHRHIEDKENAYTFVNQGQLIADFLNDVQHHRELRKWLSKQNQDEF